MREGEYADGEDGRQGDAGRSQASHAGTLPPPVRPNSRALMATITVDTDISAAPTAGEIMIPARNRTPAASRIATML